MLGEMLANSDLPPFIVPPSELEFGSFPPPYELVLATGSIIPGNMNSGHPTEKFIFQQLLPLEAEGRE